MPLTNLIMISLPEDFKKMEERKKLEYMDKVIQYLKEHHCATVPQAFQNSSQWYVEIGSIEYVEYREVQGELISKGITKKGADDRSGFVDLSLTDFGFGIDLLNDLKVKNREHKQNDESLNSRILFNKYKDKSNDE